MCTIGQRIRKRREEKQMNQTELAVRINIAPPSLNQIETGETKMPRPTTLIKLAEILETNIHWLLTGEGDPELRDALVSDPQAVVEFEKLEVQHRAAIKAMIMTFRNIENG
jgi:transcriptional regulator with XRE-family HTH domain